MLDHQPTIQEIMTFASAIDLLMGISLNSFDATRKGREGNIFIQKYLDGKFVKAHEYMDQEYTV